MSEKAADFSQLLSPFKDATKSMPGLLAAGLATGAATAVVGAIPVAAAHIYDAATKRMDFRSMMRVNADLHDMDPAHVNAGFSTLRRFNPEMSKDPYVAGTFVRRFAADPGGQAWGLAAEAVSSVPKPVPASPLLQSYHAGVGKGVGEGSKGNPVEQAEAIERMKAQIHAEGMPRRVNEAGHIARNQQRIQMSARARKR